MRNAVEQEGIRWRTFGSAHADNEQSRSLKRIFQRPDWKQHRTPRAVRCCPRSIKL